MNRPLLTALAILAALAALLAVVFLVPPQTSEREAIEDPAALATGGERPPIPPGPVEAPGRTVRQPVAPERVRARIPSEGTVVCALSYGCSVSGRAVDAQGEPVKLTTVALLGWGGSHALPEGARWAGDPILEDFARTNASGAFRFEDLPPNLRYRATILLRGTPPATSEVVTPGPGESAVLGDLVVGRGGAVSGTVLDTRGLPVNLAFVAAVPLPPTGAVSEILPFFEMEGGARTDAQGSFEVRGLPAGRLLVAAQGLDLGTAQAEITLGPDGRVGGLLLRLVEGDWIEGTISGGAWEEEIEGAVVRAEPLGDGPRFLVEADDFGEFEIEGVPAGIVYLLTIEAPGFAPATVARAMAGDDEIEVRLQPRPWIRGEITEDDGSWMPHARFGVFPVDQIPSLRVIGTDGLAHRANEDGEFAVPVDGPGAYRIVAVAPGFTPTRSEVIQVPSTGVEEVEIVLWKGAAIEGTVTGGNRLLPAEVALYEPAASGATERDASGARVPSKGSLVAVARADGRGRFLFSLAPEGRYFLEARLEGFAPARSEPFEVGRGAASRIVQDLALARPAQVVGRIEGAASSPADLRVVALGPDGEVRSAAPDESGAFRMGNLPPGRHLLLLLPAERPLAEIAWLEESAARRTAIATSEVRLAEGETAETVLTAGASGGRTLRGIVRRNGLPAAGFSVACVPESEVESPAASASAATALTDAEGTFSVEGVAPGAYVLLVRTPPSRKGGHLLLGRFPHVVGTEEGEPLQLGVLSGRLRGRVVDPAGDGLKRVRLLLAPDDSLPVDPLLASARWDADTGPEGAFDAGEAPPGAYRITVRVAGFIWHERILSLEPGAESIGEIRLERERDG